MHVTLYTEKGLERIEIEASDVSMMPHGYNLWNATLNEEHYRGSDYAVFREFCDNIEYKKPEKDSVALSQDDYYLSVPRELIDSIFVHETRCECGLKGVNNDASMPELQGRN